MGQRLYKSGQFARRASVSTRTLRFYDQVGLLAPSLVTESGYRLYTDSDLENLQQILALKFLGFSLDEIKALLQAGPQSLADVLGRQKRMMSEKREQLESIIEAIGEAEGMLRAGNHSWEALVKVIQVIQMEQKNDWAKKYFTPEQAEKMGSLSENSYSAEAKAKIAERGATWTEEDQARVSAQWDGVYAEIRRLSAEGADPSGAEAQAVRRQYNSLISAFTGGDPDVSAGLNEWWEGYGELPEGEKPFQTPLNSEEQSFLDRVMSAGS